MHWDTLLFLCSWCDSVHLPLGANYRAEIKHDQLFMQEFHPPRMKSIRTADTNFLLINGSQKYEECWLTIPTHL